MTISSSRTLDTAAIDLAAIERFVEVVFGYLEGYVPIRVLAETGTKDRKPLGEFPDTGSVLAALHRIAPAAAGNTCGLYVVPGTVARPGSARAADIVQTGAILI